MGRARLIHHKVQLGATADCVCSKFLLSDPICAKNAATNRNSLKRKKHSLIAINYKNLQCQIHFALFVRNAILFSAFSLSILWVASRMNVCVCGGKCNCI